MKLKKSFNLKKILNNNNDFQINITLIIIIFFKNKKKLNYIKFYII